jgi:hypothetical protein
MKNWLRSLCLNVEGIYLLVLSIASNFFCVELLVPFYSSVS